MSLILLSNGPKEDACHASSPLPFSFSYQRTQGSTKVIYPKFPSTINIDHILWHERPQIVWKNGNCSFSLNSLAQSENCLWYGLICIKNKCKIRLQREQTFQKINLYVMTSVSAYHSTHSIWSVTPLYTLLTWMPAAASIFRIQHENCRNQAKKAKGATCRILF